VARCDEKAQRIVSNNQKTMDILYTTVIARDEKPSSKT
jgi:hypothetical protein